MHGTENAVTMALRMLAQISWIFFEPFISMQKVATVTIGIAATVMATAILATTMVAEMITIARKAEVIKASINSPSF